MGMDQTLIERSGYTILDILSDVGGLQGILISGISLLLSILNHNSLNAFLASKLYRSDEVALTTSSQTCESIKGFCIGLLPSKFVCCQMERKQIAM